MTTNEKATNETGENAWIEVIKIVAPLVVSILIFSLGGGFIWKEFLDTPELVYTVLPTYEITGQTFGGLVVENRGRATAHEVLVSVSDFGENIEALEIRSDERATLQRGGLGKQEVTVWLDRLAPASSLTIYLVTNQRVSLDGHISVITEEGSGISASSRGLEPRFGMLLKVVIAILIPVAFGASLFLLNYSAHKEIERERQRVLLEAEALDAKETVELGVRQRLFHDVISMVEESNLDEESKKEFIRQAFEYATKRNRPSAFD